MKKIALIFSLGFVLASCSDKKVEVDFTPSNPMANETGVNVEVRDNLEFSNPSFMAGSTFGEFFLSMIRTQNYDMALKFTSAGSIEKHGRAQIVEKYKSFNYNYNLTLKSSVQSKDTFMLSYSTNEYATGKLKKMTVVIENDTCKLVLPENLGDLLK